MTKPNYVKNCRHLETCYNGKRRNCVGCNVWNYIYDANALIKWCKDHEKPINRVTMDMHRQLLGEKDS